MEVLLASSAAFPESKSDVRSYFEDGNMCTSLALCLVHWYHLKHSAIFFVDLWAKIVVCGRSGVLR